MHQKQQTRSLNHRHSNTSSPTWVTSIHFLHLYVHIFSLVYVHVLIFCRVHTPRAHRAEEHVRTRSHMAGARRRGRRCRRRRVCLWRVEGAPFAGVSVSVSPSLAGRFRAFWLSLPVCPYFVCRRVCRICFGLLLATRGFPFLIYLQCQWNSFANAFRVYPIQRRPYH